MIDADRTALAAAELHAFDGTDLETVHDFATIEALIRRVAESPWWSGGPVLVQAARADAGSSSTTCDVSLVASGSRDDRPASRIRLAAPQTTVATAAHELAHVLAGVAHGHDAVFRRGYLDVVAVITNLDSTDRRHELHVGQLTTAFAAADLDVAARSWPAPPPSAGGPFAL